jgi:4,5-DOPA dioxygenase extradiol
VTGTPERMPMAFIGHGNPMNALERNRYTDAWRALGASVPTPRAVLCVSAHWYVGTTAVTAMTHPRTIHDFFGFPDTLFSVGYPAPGAPEVADEVVEVAKPTWVGLDHDSWGLDHGTWSVLVHVFPDAQVPVVQLSLDVRRSYDEHLALGAALAPLRDQGILIVGSGNVVHNLGLVDWHRPEGGEAWADRFDEAAIEVMTTDPSAAVGLADHRDHDRAVPTPDHFLPLLYVAGAAAATGETAEVLVDGRVMGSLSMTAYTVGADAHLAGPRTGGEPPTLPEGTPPEETLT